MSTTLGKRHVEMALASGLDQAVKSCIIQYDRANTNGDTKMSPGLINAVLVSTISDTIAVVLATERCARYATLPLWKQRLNYRIRTFIAATWIARCAYRNVVKTARQIALQIEADPNWINSCQEAARRAEAYPVAERQSETARPTYL